MSRKIINKKKFSWQDDDSFKLNYQMVFDDKKTGRETPDVNKILKEQQEKWAAERETARQEAYEKGYQQGYHEASETVRSEMDSRVTLIKQEFDAAREAWSQNQELLKPGLLNLVFDISEAILGVPITNGSMRNKLEEELGALFQEMDNKSRPVLWVSAEDYEFVESLQKEYAESSCVVLRVSKHCNPGEFQLETNREKVVRDFQQMLKDFKESLILPQ